MPPWHPRRRPRIIDTWMRARSAEPICWLHGTAGVGKSAILQTICESSMGENGPVFAAFFFGRAQGRRALSQYLIPTLAYQLAQTNESYRSRLQTILEKNRDVFSQAMPAQMRTLLVGPFSDGGGGWFEWFKGLLSLTKRPTVIVIDGLDECDGEENQATIVENLAEAVRAVKQPLRFLIASRPESHILKAFNQISRHTKRVRLDHSFKPDDAIRLYLVDQFGSIARDSADTLSHTNLSPSWPGEEVITVLVVAACGQFIYASLVIAFIKTPHTNPLQQLEIVLDAARNHVAFSPLDALYFHILRNVTAHLQATLKKTLVCLVALAEPQTVGVIADILFIDETEVRLALEQLRAVLRTDSETGTLFNHPVTFAHASFRDFLIDPRRSGTYTIDITQAHNAILALLSSPAPPAALSSSWSDQSIRPRTHYAIDHDNISHHIPHLSLTSVPASIVIDRLELRTFHTNLISFFNRLRHPALDTVYLYILNNVGHSRQGRLRKVLSCLLVLGPQTIDDIADLLDWHLSDVEDVLVDIRSLLHHPDTAHQSLFDHSITFSHTSFQHFVTDPLRSERHTINLQVAHTWVLSRLSSRRGLEASNHIYAQRAETISHHLAHFSLGPLTSPNKDYLLGLSSDLVPFFEDHNDIQALDAVYRRVLHNVAPDRQPSLKVLLSCLAVLATPQTVDVIADLISCDSTELAPLALSLCAVFPSSLPIDDVTPRVFPRDSFRDFLANPQRSQEYAVDPKRAHNVILAQLSRPPLTSSHANPSIRPKMAYAPFFTHHLPHLSLSSFRNHGYAEPTEFYSNLLFFFEHMDSPEGLDVVYRQCLNNVKTGIPIALDLVLASLVILPDPSTVKDIASATRLQEMDVWLVLKQLPAIIRVKLGELQDSSSLFDSEVTVMHSSFRQFLRDRRRAGAYRVGV